MDRAAAPPSFRKPPPLKLQGADSTPNKEDASSPTSNNSRKQEAQALSADNPQLPGSPKRNGLQRGKSSTLERADTSPASKSPAARTTRTTTIKLGTLQGEAKKAQASQQATEADSRMASNPVQNDGRVLPQTGALQGASFRTKSLATATNGDDTRGKPAKLSSANGRSAAVPLVSGEDLSGTGYSIGAAGVELESRSLPVQNGVVPQAEQNAGEREAMSRDASLVRRPAKAKPASLVAKELPEAVSSIPSSTTSRSPRASARTWPLDQGTKAEQHGYTESGNGKTAAGSEEAYLRKARPADTPISGDGLPSKGEEPARQQEDAISKTKESSDDQLLHQGRALLNASQKVDQSPVSGSDEQLVKGAMTPARAKSVGRVSRNSPDPGSMQAQSQSPSANAAPKALLEMAPTPANAGAPAPPSAEVIPPVSTEARSLAETRSFRKPRRAALNPHDLQLLGAESAARPSQGVQPPTAVTLQATPPSESFRVPLKASPISDSVQAPPERPSQPAAKGSPKHQAAGKPALAIHRSGDSFSVWANLPAFDSPWNAPRTSPTSKSAPSSSFAIDQPLSAALPNQEPDPCFGGPAECYGGAPLEGNRGLGTEDALLPVASLGLPEFHLPRLRINETGTVRKEGPAMDAHQQEASKFERKLSNKGSPEGQPRRQPKRSSFAFDMGGNLPSFSDALEIGVEVTSGNALRMFGFKQQSGPMLSHSYDVASGGEQMPYQNIVDDECTPSISGREPGGSTVRRRSSGAGDVRRESSQRFSQESDGGDFGAGAVPTTPKSAQLLYKYNRRPATRNFAMQVRPTRSSMEWSPLGKCCISVLRFKRNGMIIPPASSSHCEKGCTDRSILMQSRRGTVIQEVGCCVRMLLPRA
jgi:hypothetical protein